MKKKIISMAFVLITIISTMTIAASAATNPNTYRSSYNDVFASTKGSGYNLIQAKSSASKSFTKDTYVYVWGYVHDLKNNLYNSYGSGKINMTLSIYKPNGACAHTYTYNNSDNNWIRCKLDTTGTWKIQSKISGSISGTNTQTITVTESTRKSYNDVFASTKGSGYNLSQAKSSASKTFTKGTSVYVWGYVHDGNNNLYKSYSSGKTCDMTLSVYRPDGSCYYTYSYKNSDNNWIRFTPDKAGTWKIQSKISGSISGTNTQTITVTESTRKSYNDVFASTKGSGYNLSQAKSSASKTFTKGTSVYLWGYVHDGNNNLYKSYSSGKTCDMTLSVYRPDGSCYYTYSYKNSDNNWIRFTPDKAGTWKIQSKISGSISGTNTQTITVTDNGNIEITGDILYNYPTVGDVYYLSAKATDTTKFTWSSSNSNIVSINSGGKMVAKATGSATITARTSDGRSKSVRITVCSANKWRTGNFDTGYTAKNYTTVKLNKNVGDGKIRIYTYDMLGNKTSGEIHVTLRDWNGNWIREFDTKSGNTLYLGDNHEQYRVYIAKKQYPDTVKGNGDDFINVGKCQSWAIDCTSHCYIP